MRRKILRSPAAVAIIFGAIALSLFLVGIQNPPRTYYDEGYYIPAAKALLVRAANPNPEAPPLGKILIAGSIKVFGDGPLGWRAAGAVCGSLALTALFLWTYLLSRDIRVAAIAAVLTLFNNFLFVMSRVAMMDVFLVCFLFWGLLAFTAAMELDVSAGKRKVLLYCAGTSLGFAVACKLNAVDTLAALVVVSAALLWLAKRPAMDSNSQLIRYAQNLRQAGFIGVALSLTVVPLTAYSLSYWPLFHSMHLPFGIRKLMEMHVYMWRFHVSLEVNPFISSPWYTWPFKTSPQRALSYLLGNPVVMWGGVASLVFGLRRIWKSLAFPEAFLVLLYAANLSQWAVTPVKATFYYYYFPAAMLLGVAIALPLRNLPRTIFGIRVSLILLIAAAAVFLWCYPRMAHLGAPWDCALGCWS